MNVYVRHIEEGGLHYRWNTLLQFGDSWDVLGTVVMKNPGSSNFQSNDCQIRDEELLEHLRPLSVMESDAPWHSFTSDKTMDCIQEIFEAYYGRELSGVVRIFNLCNVMCPKFSAVKPLLKAGDIESSYFCTVEHDLQAMAGPVYFGWGNAWKFCPDVAGRYFQKGIELEGTERFGYRELLSQNPFYHPLYVMRYGKGKVRIL